MLKKIAVAAAALAFAAPALADGWHGDRGHHFGHFQHRAYAGPYFGHYRPVYVAPPVFYAPPPLFYAPPPSLYIQGRSNGIAFSLGLPL